MPVSRKYITLLLPALLSGLLFGIALFGYILPKTKTSVLERQREMIRVLTEAAYSAVDAFYHQAKDGVMSQSVAEARAAELLRMMRYGQQGRDYFWINDLEGTMIMHPYRPDMEGQEMEGFEDPEGVHPFAEMIRVAKEKGAGFVTYQWQRYGNKAELGNKVSYVRLFKPWNWVIGTGVYMNEVEDEIDHFARGVTVLGLMIWLVVVGLSLYISFRQAGFDRERKKAETALLESYDLQKEIIDFLPDATWVVDRQGRVMAWNRAMEDLTGIDASQMIGKGNFKYAEPFYDGRRPMLIDLVINPNPEIESSYEGFRKEGSKLFGEVFVKNLGKTGRYLAGTAGPLRNSSGALMGAIQTMRDITRRRQLEEKLTRLATTDSLTGVNNRYHFFKLAGEEMLRARRYERNLALLMLDLDHFKNVNDTYGHQTGDVVLVELCKTCLEVIRNTDFFGRLGGEEFAVLLVETDLEAARLVAERIRAQVEERTIDAGDDTTIKITVSVGLTNMQPEDAQFKDILRRSDQALYAAKNAGRNRVVEM